MPVDSDFQMSKSNRVISRHGLVRQNFWNRFASTHVRKLNEVGWQKVGENGSLTSETLWRYFRISP